jgi:hypothetical protein
LVDSTGLKLCGAGEWLVEKHGTSRRRSWRKLHIGVDADTGRIEIIGGQRRRDGPIPATRSAGRPRNTSLVGIRSTMGLTSRAGIVPLFLNRDIGGPMARTVADTVAVFDVVAGYDPDDPVTAASQGKRPDSYLKFLDKDGLRGTRIGVVRQLFIEPESRSGNCTRAASVPANPSERLLMNPPPLEGGQFFMSPDGAHEAVGRARDRKFAYCLLEGSGFELVVPRDNDDGFRLNSPARSFRRVSHGPNPSCSANRMCHTSTAQGRASEAMAKRGRSAWWYLT